MTRIARSAAMVLGLLVLGSSAYAQVDRKGCTDYPAISRMPNFYIVECATREFDTAAFWVGPKGKEVKQQQEGRLIRIKYFLKKNAPPTSMVQIVRNLQNAAKAAGGEIVSDRLGANAYASALKLNLAGRETWVQVDAYNAEYTLTIIEKRAMQQDVVISAAAMSGALSQTGKIALYGIYFDTARASLKPESEPTLAEIAKLLKQNPALKVFIVGHTDMVGDPAANIRLSEARAQSVIAALVSRYGIAPARLKPFGAGPYAPVASNRTEEGRAKNRRVELVEFAAQ